ncbi:hypothetical protein EXU57_24480 [Segetibacter sp. 3557_3]|uniref:hypothetical protein n=1 Tax=Segetibacter sp. 3557_3 TaxID=2547429 RepID=UPI001058811C|nr:hypothetical protein [Segetibacter sp. 3557_3]TDH18034.1 hypothetical protein EXU57_24480 [Segetibacter sp. 3557_3]
MSKVSKTGDIRTFTWVDSLAEYRLFTQDHANRGIPVIKPDDLELKREWEKILNWYGLKLADENTPGSNNFEIPVNDKVKNLVVAIGKDHSDICKYYSKVSSREYLEIEHVDELSKLNLGKYNSILVAGDGKNFLPNALSLITNNIKQPSGIMSASNLPELSFFVAKLLAGDNIGHLENIYINALGRQVFSGVNNMGSNFKLSQPALTLISKKNWRSISILAHGEISHILLNSSVICGKVHPDIAAKRKNVECCNDYNGRRICIRVHNKNIQVLYIADIKSKYLQLFSCTTLNFSEKLMPENISLFRSIVRGYPVASILTNKKIVIDPGVVKIAHELTCDDISPGFITMLLNDYEEYNNNDQPYVLMGDPSIKKSPALDKWKINTLFNKVKPYYVYRLPTRYNDKVLNVELSGKVFVLRGRRYLTILFQKDSPGSFKFVVKNQEYNHNKIFFYLLIRGYRNFRVIDEGLNRLFKRDVKRVSDESKQIMLLMGLQLQEIKEFSDSASMILERIGQKKIYNEAISMYETLLKSYIEEWRSNFCLLLDDKYIFSQLIDVFSPNTIKVLTSRAKKCGYCSNKLSIYNSSLDREHYHLKEVFCSWCGVREMSTSPYNWIQISHDNNIIPGSVFKVSLKFREKVINGNNNISSYYVVIDFYNKSIEREVHHERLKLTNDGAVITIQLAGNLSGDLHVLRIVCVSESEIRFYRARVSVR